MNIAITRGFTKLLRYVIVRNMEQRRAVIVAIAIALLVALAIIGTIVFLSNFLRNKSTTNRTVVSSSSEPVIMATTEPSASPSSAASAQGSATISAPANTKSISIGGFTGFHPNTWGVLSCTNSENIEFDPNGADSSVACNYAKKPITVVVSKNLNCKGDEVTLGNNTVVKSKSIRSHEIRYRWCVKGTDTNLDITHRVTDSNLSAASKEDFSSQVEQFISTLNFPRGS